MRILRNPARTSPCVLVLGMFDGVHRGHQQLLMTGNALAEAEGIDKKAATTFSFLLSIPIIIGSALYESLDLITGNATLSISASAVVVGVIAAFLSGLAAIKFFLKLIEKHSMAGFIVYTLLLGIAVSVYPFFV